MPANDTYWRSLKKMHVVFALSAVGLFAVTLAMMWKDHDDEWRDYVTTFDRIETLRIENQIDEEKTEVYNARVTDLETQLEEANAVYAKKKEGIEDEIKDLAYQLNLAERELRNQRAFRDKARADFDLAIRDEREEAAEQLKKAFDAEQKKVDAIEKQVQDRTEELGQAQQRQQTMRDEITAIETELAAARRDVELLEKTKEQIAPESTFASIKREVMQWPIIDGFNSPHQIKQVWLPDLKITLGMAQTARFDRCQTCHRGIERVEAGNIPTFPHGEGEDFVPTRDPDDETLKKWVKENRYPHPYATHPNPDLYLTSTSPHPIQEFGCTSCHDGQGSGTNFNNVQHTPNNPFEKEHWEEKYHYHYNHFWEYPMQPDRFKESTCLKCHHEVVELANSPKFGNSAPKVVQGFHTIQQFGCFGCHEIHGKDGAESIGPDLRVEPNYFAVALEMESAAKVKLASIKQGEDDSSVTRRLKQIAELAETVATAPDDTENQRWELQQLVLADKTLDAPLFDSHVHRLADELKTVENPGQYRKVGPSLRYLDKKTSVGWVEYWTNKPSDFRPSTRMPQFFHLSNQEDPIAEAYQPVQVAAIGHYLIEKSKETQPLDLLSPKEGYKPDPERGKKLFSERGCLACHSYKDFPEIKSDFGPNLDKVYAKLKPGQAGFQWLYSWIREPHRYNKRTKMPDLYLEPYVPKGKDQTKPENEVDPAADIAAYLLQEREKNTPKYEAFNDYRYDVILTSAGESPEAVSKVVADATGLNADAVSELMETARPLVRVKLPKNEADALVARLEEAGGKATAISNLDRLVSLYLAQALTINQMSEFGKSRLYPYQPEQIKGDEIELVYQGDEKKPTDEEWQAMKLNYVGRRTISQYGCYGCHDVPGFESAKPIGATLQDWGRKATSRLAFEHIGEFLHHHKMPGTDKTLTEQVDQAMKRANADEFKTSEEANDALSLAFYYDSLMHHGRPGFIWQKLRMPRSYDYKKIETKRYDERLRMPKFPFDDEQVESVATFVLGLIAEPPADKYVFNPQGATQARFTGEALLHKYNCTSCHMVDLPEVKYAIPPRITQSEVIDWLLENRKALLSGELGYPAQPADEEVDESAYQAFKKPYRELNQNAEKFASISLNELAEKANAVSKGEPDEESVAFAFTQYLEGWFKKHPRVLGSTYSDALASIMFDQTMTRDQIVTWFVDHREKLVAGQLKEYPDDIDLMNKLCKYFGLGIDATGIAKLANIDPQDEERQLTAKQINEGFRANLLKWFENHPEVLLTELPDVTKGKLPGGVRSLLKLKPPVDGTTNAIGQDKDAILKFHGMGSLVEGEYSYTLWDTLDVGGRILMPKNRILFTPEQVVDIDEGRGGHFTEWLVNRLSAGDLSKISKARQSSPPPLVLEGLKVQTPWLFKFLKNPGRIRNETVLRMPRFNMSDAEARAFANYFAAVDGAKYPYQEIPQTEAAYAAKMNRMYQAKFAKDSGKDTDYLSESWMLFGKFKACRQCHSIAGDELKVTDPTQLTHGPDLNTRVAARFRPDYLDAWLQSPDWVLPYTAMVGPTAAPEPDYFNGDPNIQVQALRDAILNFNKLLEEDGKIEPPPPAKATPMGADAAVNPGNEADRS